MKTLILNFLTRFSVEADFFNTGGTAVRHCASILACVPSASCLPLPDAHLHYLLHQGRAEFEYICSECGEDPEQLPLVSDAVLGMRKTLGDAHTATLTSLAWHLELSLVYMRMYVRSYVPWVQYVASGSYS